MDWRFKGFAAALTTATREHYERLAAKGDDLYGYSLYTSDDVPSMGPVANYESSLKVPPTDKMYNYYRYGPHEWVEHNDHGLFQAPNNILKALHRNLKFQAYRSGALATGLEVLTQLESEGLFGPRTDSRYVVLWVTDSSDSVMGTSAKTLNSPRVYASYLAEYA